MRRAIIGILALCLLILGVNLIGCDDRSRAADIEEQPDDPTYVHPFLPDMPEQPMIDPAVPPPDEDDLKQNDLNTGGPEGLECLDARISEGEEKICDEEIGLIKEDDVNFLSKPYENGLIIFSNELSNIDDYEIEPVEIISCDELLEKIDCVLINKDKSLGPINATDWLDIDDDEVIKDKVGKFDFTADKADSISLDILKKDTPPIKDVVKFGKSIKFNPKGPDPLPPINKKGMFKEEM